MTPDPFFQSMLGLIGLYRAAVSAVRPMLREACGGADLAAALVEGRIKGRGKQRFFDYRVSGDMVVVFRKIRIEFNFIHPNAFSAYLLTRHLKLNGMLKRMFPQYAEMSVTQGLDDLQQRDYLRVVEGTTDLFELTEAGEAKLIELRRAL